MVFPARAGMSPAAGGIVPHRRGVPRASGDEPMPENLTGLVIVCSPRERG